MKKTSVIISDFYNNENLNKCIESINNQSYKNLEIIIIKDKEHEIDIENKKIKIVERNSESINEIYSLGLEKAEGNYLSFINGNDYVSCDFYRMMIESIETGEKSIAISQYALKEKDKYIEYQFTIFNELIKSKKNILDTFIETNLLNDRWFITPIKLIKREVLEKVVPILKKYKSDIKINNEILLTILLYQNCNDVAFCNAIYFMNSKDDYKEKIDLESIKEFIKREKINIDIDKIKQSELEDNSYYNSKSDYNFDEEIIKQKIIEQKNSIISFDMFDTLILRPFFRPLDLFTLMDKEFHNISKTSPIVKFSKIRIEVEADLRIKLKREIKIDEIYENMSKKYELNKKVCDKMKLLEKKLEEKFCYRREFAYELYRLAKYLKKRVIVVSDIYLDRATISKILTKNKYKFDEIYLSSELLKTKSEGTLYDYVIKKEKNNIFHIGDNITSDYEKAKERGIDSFLLPRTIDKFMEVGFGKLFEDFEMFNINMNYFMKDLSVRCSLSLVANKYFDNPFRAINSRTKFNQDPELIGYYALGMHLLSLSKWLLDDTKLKDIDSLSFISRDGYVPFNAVKIFNKNTNLNEKTEFNYIYASRKSLLPLVFNTKSSINAMDTYLDYSIISPQILVNIFKSIIDDKNNKYIELLKQNKIDYKKPFKDKDEFYLALSLLYDSAYSKIKYNNYSDIVKEYFNSNMYKNPAVFDIGYSGKPQAIISELIGKPVHTYFYHITSNEPHENSYIANYELNTYYDFIPTLTGTIRELFYSDISPTCIGYKIENNKCVPVLGNEERYTYFNKNMIKIVQKSSLEFVEDFTSIFSDYIDLFSLNKFYMSSIYEYYAHYSEKEDKNIFYRLFFESNINDSNDINYYIDLIMDKYSYYNEARRNKIVKNIEDKYMEIIKKDYIALPKNRLKRILLYLLFDRSKINNKLKSKFKSKES